jgi:tRNA threonylcarbamoyladenosine dehydratase
MPAAPSQPPPEASDPRDRFGGIERLFGRGALRHLAASHVCVIGLGGVGSWTVEALARTGVGALTLVDLDDVCVTNINRQIPALDSTIGRAKAAVLAERVAAINPACRVDTRIEYFTEVTADRLLGGDRFDWVVDAIDSLANKCLLVARCRAAGLPVVCSGGAGGRSDPTQVRVDDLAFTHRDQLLKDVRKRLRQRFGFPRDESAPFGVPAVYSEERPVYPQRDGSVCPQPQKGDAPAINCESGVGTAAFVTGAFGLAAAAVVVRAIVARAR